MSAERDAAALFTTIRKGFEGPAKDHERWVVYSLAGPDSGDLHGPFRLFHAALLCRLLRMDGLEIREVSGKRRPRPQGLLGWLARLIAGA